MDVNVVIGGPQGGGIETAGMLAVRTLVMAGLEVFGDREYHSNIKGKHSYFHIRAADRPVGSIRYPVDVLGALDAETLGTHFHEVKDGGVVVYDSALSSKSLTRIPSLDPIRVERLKEDLLERKIGETVEALSQYLGSRGTQVVPIPFSKLLSEVLKFPNPLIARTMNTSITAALLTLMGVQQEAISKAVGFLFREKEEVAELNLKVVEAVCDFVKSYVKREPVAVRRRTERRLLVAGNDSVAIGKLMGGLRLQTYYPITPAADESFDIEENFELRDSAGNIIGNPVVVQTEDEISAIAMAIGGALAGTRSATSTSGPGFSLMAEGLSWAGNNEVPVVITHYQRGGPSTGLPTRHSQSDLLFTIFAGHGEFARIVLASGDHREAMADAVKSLNYAERYQVPVIHLLDKGVANCVTTTTLEERFEITRGKRFDGVLKEGEVYRRFRFTDDGISPRAFLGEETMWYSGDEHNELGNICEDPLNRNRMYAKRMEKSRRIMEEAPDEDKALLHGPERYDDLILTWGITKGAAVDALESMGRLGRRVAVLQVRMMEPFPGSYISKFLSEAAQVIDVEANYLGQLAELVRLRCGMVVRNRVLKYTGRIVTEDEVASSYERILKGEERIVLWGGE
ncbi:MAG: 2-oxoacid:acceptor oxidoreductase subunit alpha [Candidatus Verstraetearchaeota archaeon]|nr:2-oxoacid:acceptor oxidoreductase subunit alpha [Candidatus Verstraetearchaeota archaeon]